MNVAWYLHLKVRHGLDAPVHCSCRCPLGGPLTTCTCPARSSSRGPSSWPSPSPGASPSLSTACKCPPTGECVCSPCQAPCWREGRGRCWLAGRSLLACDKWAGLQSRPYQLPPPCTACSMGHFSHGGPFTAPQLKVIQEAIRWGPGRAARQLAWPHRLCTIISAVGSAAALPVAASVTAPQALRLLHLRFAAPLLPPVAACLPLLSSRCWC